MATPPAKTTQARSKKHALIDKANATTMVAIAATSVVVVFSLVAGRSLLGQYSYQNQVIKQKKLTLAQVSDSSENVTKLVSSYKAFAGGSVNVLGGSPTGSGPLDGDNPRIVLDALPSKYDFPGLISSLEKLVSSGGYTINSIGGAEIVGAGQELPGPSPVLVEIPFPVTITADYAGIQKFIATLEASIRPMYITNLSLSGTDASMQLTIKAKTFYQSEKTFDVTNEVIK